MSYQSYRISIETVENGFVVELPDWTAIAEKEKAAKKRGDSSPLCYIGDCTEKYTAKDIPAVVKLVKDALSNMPETEFDKAFGEAADKS